MDLERKQAYCSCKEIGKMVHCIFEIGTELLQTVQESREIE